MADKKSAVRDRSWIRRSEIRIHNNSSFVCKVLMAEDKNARMIEETGINAGMAGGGGMVKFVSIHAHVGECTLNPGTSTTFQTGSAMYMTFARLSTDGRKFYSPRCKKVELGDYYIDDSMFTQADKIFNFNDFA